MGCHVPDLASMQGSGGKEVKRMDIDLPEEEEEVEVSDEDLEFVSQHGGRIGFLTNLDKAALDK